MVDFHTHILPGMDDGAKDIQTGLHMLRMSFLQGADYVVSTSHFYPDDEYPDEFLRRRARAWEQLSEAMLLCPTVFPDVTLGAEVLFFPGISRAGDIADLSFGIEKNLLVEAPMARWSDNMLDEVAVVPQSIHCRPILAHVDRYMQLLNDTTLIERAKERNIAVQINADYFIRCTAQALTFLRDGQIDFIGSDCHNLNSRAPNLADAKAVIKCQGLLPLWHEIENRSLKTLKG